MVGHQVDWGKKEKDYDPAEEYPGTKPFRWLWWMGSLGASPTGSCLGVSNSKSSLLSLYSEPEVQTVLHLARELKPHVWLNVHSGMEALFVPWDHKAEV